MTQVKPSSNPQLHKVTPDIPAIVRAMTTKQLLEAMSGSLPYHLRPQPESYMGNMKMGANLHLEFKVRLQMAGELMDLRADDDSPVGSRSNDLSVLHCMLLADTEDAARQQRYGEDADTQGLRWYVECRKNMWPWTGCLPLGFGSREDAMLAIQGLERAGLHTADAMHKRIKVDLDWDGVKRIMIEALQE